MSSPEPAQREPVVVGLALKKEKRKKHISDKLVRMAAEAGITLKFIDKEQPLEQQGPFAAILQKVRKPEWERELVEYAARHPETQVFDLPAATYPLRNRGSMVSFLDGDGWAFEEPPALVEPGRRPQRCRCNVPTNLTLAEGTGLEAAMEQMAAAGLRYPVLAKPLWADGRDGSHALAVVHAPRGLARMLQGQVPYLQLPVMLQQYVDHGGCLFKVYVLGDTSVRVKRNSLHLPPWTWVTPPPAVTAAEQQQQQQQGAVGGAASAAGQTQGGAAAGLGRAKGAVEALLGEDGQPELEMMERVSAYPATKSWGRADTAPKGHGVPSPPAWLLQALAQRLRLKTGLSLFNFDVIMPMQLHRRLHQSPSPCKAAPASGGGSAPSSNGASTLASIARAALADADGAAAAAAAAEEPVAVELSQAPAGHPVDADGSRGEPQGPTQPAGQQQAGEPGEGPGEELLYHLIDINYFPGYEKMPDYEQYMVQFLRTVASPRRSMRTVVADGPQRAAAEQHAEQAAAEAAPGQP